MPLLIRTCVLKGHESAPSDLVLKVTQLYRVDLIESSAYANRLEASLSVEPILLTAGLDLRQQAA